MRLLILTQKYFYLILSLTAVMISFQGWSQNQLSLSLSDAIENAKTKSKQFQISQKDYELAKAQYESTRSVLLPQLRLSNTSTFTNNPLHAFGFKLLQRNVGTPDFDPVHLNEPGDVENFNTRIELLQPLINIDGWKQRSSSNLQLKISSLQSQRMQEYMELEVTKTYMQLQLAYKSVDVHQKALQTAEEMKRQSKAYLEQGLIKNADYLLIQVHQLEIENQLQAALSLKENISEYLAFLMGQKEKISIVPSDEFDLIITQVTRLPELNLNRKDLMALALNIEAQEKMLESSKMNFVPRANALASYEWNDSSVFGFGANNYLIGIQLSWDLFKGYKNIGKIHQEKAILERASIEKNKYVEESEIELNSTYRKNLEARKKVASSLLAFEQSKEAQRIISNRFDQGLEKINDLLLAENRTQEKELEYLQSLFEFHFSKAYLNFLTK